MVVFVSVSAFPSARFFTFVCIVFVCLVGFASVVVAVFLVLSLFICMSACVFVCWLVSKMEAAYLSCFVRYPILLCMFVFASLVLALYACILHARMREARLHVSVLASRVSRCSGFFVERRVFVYVECTGTSCVLAL
mgnify:CR=1 FL=1